MGGALCRLQAPDPEPELLGVAVRKNWESQ